MENVMDMSVVFQIWVKDYKGLIRFKHWNKELQRSLKIVKD